MRTKHIGAASELRVRFRGFAGVKPYSHHPRSFVLKVPRRLLCYSTSLFGRRRFICGVYFVIIYSHQFFFCCIGKAERRHHENTPI